MYVAFLRGINVGGNALLKMTELKKSFESLGFTNVVPVLASGNVVFETSTTVTSVLKQRIEEKLATTFRVQIIAIVRTGPQILDLLKLDPFKNVKITPQTKLHVTFLAEETKQGGKFPRPFPSKEFQIMQVSPCEICSAVVLSSNARTPELMKLLEKEFGKKITTRTWNTLQKIGTLIV